MNFYFKVTTFDEKGKELFSFKAVYDTSVIEYLRKNSDEAVKVTIDQYITEVNFERITLTGTGIKFSTEEVKVNSTTMYRDESGVWEAIRD